MERKLLGREHILKYMVDAFEPLDYVFGMWQCGSAAFGRVDDWSDIDVIVDIADDKIEEFFQATDKVLEALSPIENELGFFKTIWAGAYQKTYKLKDTSKFLVIEICAVQHSGTYKFLEKEIHGDIYVHFDKKNITSIAPIDKKEFAKKLETRLEGLENRFTMYQFLVEKELNRHNYMEAKAFYNAFSLNPLVEVLRMKYKPFRYNFGSRYVHYDFPKEIVNKLEGFYFIKDGNDLKEKHQKIVEWVDELIGELKDIDFNEVL